LQNQFSEYISGRSSQRLSFACSNGTSALFLALIAIDIHPGDEIIIPSYTCSALLNAINMCGGKAVLCDSQVDNPNPSKDEISKKVSALTKAIIVTHSFGIPSPVIEISTLGIPIIEDCCQALGTIINGKKTGNFSSIAVYSFFASKMITTGNGGMISTTNPVFAQRIEDYLDFDGRLEYKHRFNLQFSDLQAAMGRVQLEKLPSFILKRKNHAQAYIKILIGSRNLSYFHETTDEEFNHYRFILKFQSFESLLIAKNFFLHKGIQSILPVEKFELLHTYLAQDPKDFPNAEKFAATCLSIPVYPALQEEESRRIENALIELIS